MERYALFVDAGYFFAGGAHAAFGAATPRKQLSIKSPANLINALHAQASPICNGIQLLRVYWYDAMPGPRLSLEQTNLALLAGLKLRLGALNSAGEQKGVDSLLVTDLIDLARNRAIADAVVVSGDEDLRIAVQVAQSFGVRVHILAAGEPSRNVSPALQMEADSLHALPDAWFVEQFVRTTLTLPAGATQERPERSKLIVGEDLKAPQLDAAATDIIKETLTALPKEQLVRLKDYFATQTTVPPEYDRKMIAKTSVALSGRKLTGDEMRHIRGIFVRIVRELAG